MLIEQSNYEGRPGLVTKCHYSEKLDEVFVSGETMFDLCDATTLDVCQMAIVMGGKIVVFPDDTIAVSSLVFKLAVGGNQELQCALEGWIQRAKDRALEHLNPPSR